MRTSPSKAAGGATISPTGDKYVTLLDGLVDVPTGKLATIVTSLEMAARPSDRPTPSSVWSVERKVLPDLHWYRDLYRRIGQEWLWSSRLLLSDRELSDVLHDKGTEVYALNFEGCAEGLVELHHEGDTCELVFFGVTEKVRKARAGKWLMAHAIDIAWSKPIRRFWLHTCTLDHPNALPFYMRSGFTPFRRQVEVMDDPRLAGIVPRHSAPHIPMIESRSD